MRVKGDKELRATLRRLANTPAGRELDLICQASLEPLRQETASAAVRQRIAYADDVVVAKVQGSGRRRVFWVSFRGLGRKLAHLDEFGTQPHSTAPGASVRDGVLVGAPPMHAGSRPRPFFRPAFEATKGEALRVFGRRMMDAITAVVRGTPSS